MGVLLHSSTIVTSINDEALQEAHHKAISLYEQHYKGSGKLVSDIVPSLMNRFKSFFIGPHGSNMGWEIQEQCSKAQEQFIDWMTEHGDYLEFESVTFGDDLYR